MSTTPMIQQPLQQYGQTIGQQPQIGPGPSTAPPMQPIQQFGPQITPAFGPQLGQQIYSQPLPIQQQLQQLGEQQPYQHLLHQMATATQQAVKVNVATRYWDVVQPLPGQSPILYLLVDNAWRQLINPSQIVHDEIQRAFAFGHQVFVYYDDQNPTVIKAIVVTK